MVNDSQNCISRQDFSFDLQTGTSRYLLDKTTWLIQVPTVFSAFPVSTNDFIHLLCFFEPEILDSSLTLYNQMSSLEIVSPKNLKLTHVSSFSLSLT